MTEEHLKRVAIAGVVLAFALGSWLRLHGLGMQVVQDDEWHAIHKLMAASYGEILRSFGYSDHSIPLTLFYKALAGSVGLDEVSMRILQAACGIALIGVCARLAWLATRDAAVTFLFAMLVAGAPFLVLYSRFARPYAITTLLTVVVLALLWRWHTARSNGTAVVACALAGLAAWLHPLSALFPMAALAFLLADDFEARSERGLGRTLQTVTLGAGAGATIALALAMPLLADLQSLSSKAGHSAPGVYTLFRMTSLFLGGLPDAVTSVALVVSVFGAYRFRKTFRGLGAYLIVVGLVPVLAVMLLGASWSHQGHTFGRYVFPAQLVLLFWFSNGLVALVRAARGRAAPGTEILAAAAIAGAYIAVNPAIHQVRTLGAWYGNLYHHFDYIYEHNRAARYFERATPPRFYEELRRAPPYSAPVIHAPFTFEAPFNLLAHYASAHRQPELVGFLHDLCLEGPRYGEVPRDPRFRFRRFVFLGDPRSVAASGARYLLLHNYSFHGEPFKRWPECLSALKRLYGEPIEVDSSVAVFDLQRPPATRTLQ
jgi:hypothetical protein